MGEVILKQLEEYPEVRKWLRGKADGTKVGYLSGMRAYLEYTKLNPTELIDEAEKDREKKIRNRGIPEGQVMGFQKYLLKEYVKKARGKAGKNGRKKSAKKAGTSERLAMMYCMAARSFYKSNGFRLGAEGAEFRLTKSTKVKANSKLQLRADDVTRMLNACSRLRDKAIILFMFQGFQAVGEICSLDYGDVQKDLENGSDILTIEMIRKKTKTEYVTCVGDEAIDALKLYLQERVRNGDVLEYETPLFTKEGRSKAKFTRITEGVIDYFFKEIAIKSGLVSEERMKVASMNPARPHSLRSSGMSVAKLSGMPEVLVEFMAGHKMGEIAKAYNQFSLEEIAKIYREHYHALRVLKPKLDEAKVKKLETRVMKRDDVIDALVENGKMKAEKIEFLTNEVESLSQNVEKLNARWEPFTATMNMNPEEMDALTEFIGKIRQAQSREAFQITAEDNKEAKAI